MHNTICLILIVLSLILAVTAIATPNWHKTTGASMGGLGDSTSGLFENCTGNKSHLVCTKITNATKWLEACRGLAITGVTLLVIALACSFVSEKSFAGCGKLKTGALVLATILLIACVSLYVDKTKSTTKSLTSDLRTDFGYSYGLFVGAVILALGSAICSVFSHTTGKKKRG
jgi:hypothetical protein